ncbi:hypothetical protein [Nocardioides bruguierae]|uniref:Uncharacterized protein n=1 Tax=Nocardioides bruguierae TaxID=2945102 RepID=A0A9X2IGN1_9ACTN|nr:hypothetical protein [Nocardioides bruguierae]MCM0622193.1 hypothetical protein [Nocardioides bruguierae]
MTRRLAVACTGVALGAAWIAARRTGPHVLAHPVTQEARRRTKRAVHVLRGRPLLADLHIEDGTIYIDPGDRALLDGITVIGGPPRVAVADIEQIMADAVSKAVAAAYSPTAIHVGPRPSTNRAVRPDEAAP